MHEPLDYAIDAAGIARITLNRPKRANSVDPELADALMAALEHLAAEPKARVLVLLGNGRSFCSGIDLNWMKEGGTASYEQNYADALKLAKILHRLHTLPVPTIAAVVGPRHRLWRRAGRGLRRGGRRRHRRVPLLRSAARHHPRRDLALCRGRDRHPRLPPILPERRILPGRGSGPPRSLHGVCKLEEFGAVTAQMVAELLAGKKHAQTAIKSLLDDVGRPRIDEALIEDTARRLAQIRATPEAQAALADFLAR